MPDIFGNRKHSMIRLYLTWYTPKREFFPDKSHLCFHRRGNEQLDPFSYQNIKEFLFPISGISELEDWEAG